ncbi:MAG: peptidoglycan-binding protein, partial [Candidatus Niyogibacteria bacterium]|nr:peptidoglycan-binding protein [Candidatus Niyogibacteria bacterium]
TSIVRTFTFTAPLYFGLRGSAVTELQKFLAQDKTLYPEGLMTGYFGRLTELAVRRFQKHYGLAQEGDPAFGFVGPKTRAKLNSF